MALIPPQPAGSVPGEGFWNDWIEKIRTIVNDLQQGLIAHNDLQNIQGGSASERYHLTLAQQTAVAALPTLADGTYTPTVTAVANLSDQAPYTNQYLRVGNTVTVSGFVYVDPTVVTTTTQVGISLPVASNFANIEDLAGTAVSVGGEKAALYADAANNRAMLEWVTSTIAAFAFAYTFTYRII
jgi:hypothetical protein